MISGILWGKPQQNQKRAHFPSLLYQGSGDAQSFAQHENLENETWRLIKSSAGAKDLSSSNELKSWTISGLQVLGKYCTGELKPKIGWFKKQCACSRIKYSKVKKWAPLDVPIVFNDSVMARDLQECIQCNLLILWLIPGGLLSQNSNKSKSRNFSELLNRSSTGKKVGFNKHDFAGVCGTNRNCFGCKID